MEKWIEIALGAPRHNGTVIPVSQLEDYIRKAQDANLELYRSVFLFDEDIQTHMRSNKSPSGYNGIKYIDQLVFDIDKGKDSDAMCHHRAKTFADSLFRDWELTKDLVHFYYSGTGYHIVTPDIFGFEPAPDLPKTVKTTLSNSFSGPDMVFYHHAGLIRVPDTINEKTERYKIYLTYDEMFGEYADIIALSKEPRDIPIPPFPPYQSRNINKQLIRKETPSRKVTLESEAISRNAPCFQTMYSIGEEVGYRHARLIRLAAHYRKQGMPVNAAVAALQAYVPSLDSYEVDRQVRNVYDKEYSWGCNDEELMKFCSPNCIYHKNKDYAPLIMTAADMEKAYVKHRRTDYGASVFDFADLYNIKDYNGKKKECKVYPQQFIVLIGETGIGKTAVAQNIAVDLTGMRTLYVSTEVGGRLLWRRFVQIQAGMTKEQVDMHYTKSENTYSTRLKHIDFIHKSMTTEELRTIVQRHNPNLVILDVIDGITAPRKTAGTNENDIEVISTIRDIVEQHNLIVLGVHHISKHAAETMEGEAKRLTMHSGKGSSSFEQKADIVLGFEGDPQRETRSLTSLKGRDIDPFRVLVRFDKATFRITNLNL